MTKHTPATPLPWRFAKMEGGKRLALVNKHGGLISYLDCSEEKAAYIAHAANAYPKLVEALRQMSDVHGRAVDSIGRQVLRELGEDA